MIDNITVIKWTEDDWEVFKAMRLEAVTYNSHFYLTNFETESAKDDEYWKSSLRDTHNGTVFGIYVGKIVVGLMGAFRHRDYKIDTAILGMVYIRNEYRGMSLSNHLYKVSLDWAKSQDGIKRILISHRQGNEASKVTVQKLGFEFYEKEKTIYGDGTTDFSYRYELKI
jgi:RimJ/RimL family protein N-acetyltransferase